MAVVLEGRVRCVGWEEVQVFLLLAEGPRGGVRRVRHPGPRAAQKDNLRPPPPSLARPTKRLGPKKQGVLVEGLLLGACRVK